MSNFEPKILSQFVSKYNRNVGEIVPFHKNQMIVHAQFCSALTNVLVFIYFKLQSKSCDYRQKYNWVMFLRCDHVHLVTIFFDYRFRFAEHKTKLN